MPYIFSYFPCSKNCVGKSTGFYHKKENTEGSFPLGSPECVDNNATPCKEVVWRGNVVLSYSDFSP